MLQHRSISELITPKLNTTKDTSLTSRGPTDLASLRKTTQEWEQDRYRAMTVSTIPRKQNLPVAFR